MDAERVWREAAAAVEVELETEVVEEAYEVYVAEAARTRLTDREGAAHLRLRSGSLLEGDVVADEPIAEHLRVLLATGEVAIVPVTGLVAVRGTRPMLRAEESDGSSTLSSWLRSCWLGGVRMRATTVDGLAWTGTIAEVGADYVSLVDDAGEFWLLPVASVECWIVASAAG